MESPDTATASPEPSQLRSRLLVALGAAHLLLWEWDPAADELVWDEGSAALFAPSATDTGNALVDLEARTHPDDRFRFRDALRRTGATGGSVDVQFRVVHPDGEVRWLYARGQTSTRSGALTARVIGTIFDVTDQRHTGQQRTDDAQQMAGLVAVAHALGDARSEVDVLEIVSRHGIGALGAQGAGLCLVSPDRTHVRVLTTDFFADRVRADLAELPADLALPIVRAATTGTAYFLPTRAAAEALFPGTGELYAAADTEGSAEVPLPVRGPALGSLSVAYRDRHDWRPAARILLEALAGLVSQALQRIRAQQAETEAMTAVRRLSETLQRSLLTAPPATEGVEIAVRYQPAAREAEVGGDWYDAFRTPDRKTTLVIGDVTGHDRDAAAVMAQVRNVLRGVAQTVIDPPAAVLSSLDRAMTGLEVGALVTAVVCQLDPAPVGQAPVVRTVQWSNAGHPPPLLLRPDGTVELLTRTPDRLLGLELEAVRVDHQVQLTPGCTLVLYTDGLIERRHETLDDGLARLQALAARHTALSAEELCDALLGELAHDAEDDIALLAIRVRPDGGPAARLPSEESVPPQGN